YLSSTLILYHNILQKCSFLYNIVDIFLKLVIIYLGGILKWQEQKKDYKALNIKIESTIYERLENYAEEKGQTKTKAVERLLTKAMDLEEKDIK
ncbi:hypothetical protein DXA62_15505, partial [Coprobacillus sp. OF03-2AA]